MSHTHWVPRGTGIPKDREEVNKREVWECDGWVCDLDVMKERYEVVCLLWINKVRVKEKTESVVYYESIKRELKRRLNLLFIMNQ